MKTSAASVFFKRTSVVLVVVIIFGAIPDWLFPYRVWAVPDIEGYVSSDHDTVTVIVSKNGKEFQRVVADHQGHFRIDGTQVNRSRFWSILGGDTVKTSRVEFEAEGRTLGFLDVGLEGAELYSSAKACVVLIIADAPTLDPDDFRLKHQYVSAQRKKYDTNEELIQLRNDFFTSGK